MATPIQNLMAQLFQLVQLSNQQRGLDIQESQVTSQNEARRQSQLESAMTILSNTPMESRPATIAVLANAGIDPELLTNLANAVPESFAIQLDRLRSQGIGAVDPRAAASVAATGALPGQLAQDVHTADTFATQGANLGLTPEVFQQFLQEGFARSQTGLTAGGRAIDQATANLSPEQHTAAAQISTGLRMSAPQAAQLGENARQFNEMLDFDKLRFGATNANDVANLILRQAMMQGQGEEAVSPADQINALRGGLTAMEMLQAGRLPPAGAHALQNLGAQLMVRSGVMDPARAAELFKLNEPDALTGSWKFWWMRGNAGSPINTLQP